MQTLSLIHICDVLVILEAMKMENEIVAPQDGTVASVNVNKGDTCLLYTSGFEWDAQP